MTFSVTMTLAILYSPHIYGPSNPQLGHLNLFEKRLHDSQRQIVNPPQDGHWNLTQFSLGEIEL